MLVFAKSDRTKIAHFSNERSQSEKSFTTIHIRKMGAQKMELRAVVNVPRFIEEMAKRRLNLAQTAALCHVSPYTLKDMLRGAMPRKLPSFYRCIEALEIPITEALLGMEGHKVQVLDLARKTEREKKLERYLDS